MKMKSVKRMSKLYKEKIKVLQEKEYQGLEVNARMALIHDLIPIALMKVQEELQAEVAQLCGERYERGTRLDRYGFNPGSVVLGGQRVSVQRPRVRNSESRQEVELRRYAELQESSQMNELVMRRVMMGISCGNYEMAAGAVPEAFGLSGSNVSRKFIQASSKRLRELQERNLSGYDIVVLWMDGKRFAQAGLIAAVGLTMQGKKIVLGLVEAASESAVVVGSFLQQLIDRGLCLDGGLLVIVDGSKGLIKAVKQTFGNHALIQRCQWHKRENALSYMSKEEQPWLRQRLQHAYERPTYEEAKRALMKIHAELENKNQSAAASLEEGFEETLTLHQLGVFGILGKSLKTTNCMESIFSQVERRCRNVGRWHNSSQRQRWMASALLDIEPNLRCIKGHQHLQQLRDALKKKLGLQQQPLPLAA